MFVNLIARTSKFDRNLKKSKSRVKKFGQSFAAASRKMGAFSKKMGKIGAMATAGIAVGLTVIVKKTMTATDRIGKLAASLEMLPEHLIALSHAAVIAGSSEEVFQKATMKMNKSIGEASAGIGEAKNLFKDLGISIQDLQKNNPAENWALIAKKIDGMATATDRMYAATSIYGRAGGEFLVLLKSIAKDGLGGVVKEAERLNILLSKKSIAKIEAANDAMARWKATLRGIAQTLTVALAPAIERYGDKAADATARFSHNLKANEARIVMWSKIVVAKINLVKNNLMSFAKYMKSDLGGGMKVIGKTLWLSLKSLAKVGVTIGYEIGKAIGLGMKAGFKNLFGFGKKTRQQRIKTQYGYNRLGSGDDYSSPVNIKDLKRATAKVDAEIAAEKTKQYAPLGIISTKISNTLNEASSQMQSIVAATGKTPAGRTFQADVAANAVVAQTTIAKAKMDEFLGGWKNAFAWIMPNLKLMDAQVQKIVNPTVKGESWFDKLKDGLASTWGWMQKNIADQSIGQPSLGQASLGQVGQFQEFDPNLLSVSGLAIGSMDTEYLRRIADNTNPQKREVLE